MMTTLLIVSLYYCSSDSSSTPTATKSVSVKIDGVQKNFSKVEITQEPWTENGVPRIDLHVTAMNPDDNTEYVHFGIGKGDIGEDQLWDFAYVKNGTEYPVGQAGLYSATTINIEKRIVGTFSGGVSSNGVNHVLSDGIFDIQY